MIFEISLLMVKILNEKVSGKKYNMVTFKHKEGQKTFLQKLPQETRFFLDFFKLLLYNDLPVNRGPL